MIASRLLNLDGKVLFLAPTKPLVEQHAEFLRNVLRIDSERIITLSGEISPEKREEMYRNALIVVSTPQVIENDILAGRFSLEDVVHITFDEAHRAVGNYSYVFIAKSYLREAKNPLILAITASPGSDIERIREVIENLGIEEIEIRTEYDSDVRSYVHERVVEWIKVEMPSELVEVRDKFLYALEMRFNKLEKLGLVGNAKIRDFSKKELLSLQEALHAEAMQTKDPSLFEGISVMAEILKIYHGIELIETQGLDALRHYMKRLVAEGRSRGGSKASRNLISDPVFREAMLKALKCKIDHPKLTKLKEIVADELKSGDSRIIVFTTYRDTADMLIKELSEMERVRASKFVGQANRVNDKGMRQKEQLEILSKFREGIFNVLVATSVGEEGLDIPSTDLVIFYEAVPSEIRTIQRRGRTGRARKGKIIVLITKGTRDEGYYWSSMRKERMMYERIYELRDKLREIHRDLTDGKQSSLVDFMSEQSASNSRASGIQVFVDSRETKSGVVRALHDMGVTIKMQNLEVADYVLSDRVAVERKTADDFVNSLTKGERDLFSQLLNLKKSYSKPLLILEGDLYSRMIHPNAIRGALATIVVDLGIPAIQTKSATETAELLVAIARREQQLRSREVVLHAGKTKKTLKEQQEYIVSAISNIGPVIAKNLLNHFQTIERIVNATEEELIEVPKVGKKTAEKIKRVLTTPYSEADRETNQD